MSREVPKAIWDNYSNTPDHARPLLIWFYYCVTFSEAFIVGYEFELIFVNKICNGMKLFLYYVETLYST